MARWSVDLTGLARGLGENGSGQGVESLRDLAYHRATRAASARKLVPVAARLSCPKDLLMPGNPGVSYDEVPYDSQAFHETHPDHLATIARLHGLKPVAPSQARVLELGCASGGNLIPMALSLPEARLVGVDLSARQVADGQKVVERLGLKNLDLRAQSLADLDAGLGPFDYIICHGVYSWVPPALRERILEICHRHLSDQGVAFISYNTYPGWHGLQMIREMMLYHTADLAEPGAKVKAVRQFLGGLTANVADPMTPYAQMLRREIEQLLQKTDSYLLHEYLEEENEPVYYHQFLETAARHGLMVLADARPKTSTEAAGPAVLAFLESLGGQDVARQEQYMDFLRGRTFRRSLLVKQGAEISARTSAAAVGELWAMAACGPISPMPDIFTDHPEEFRTSSGQQQITTNSPIMKAAMVVLVESWPGSVRGFRAAQAGARASGAAAAWRSSRGFRTGNRAVSGGVADLLGTRDGGAAIRAGSLRQRAEREPGGQPVCSAAGGDGQPGDEPVASGGGIDGLRAAGHPAG